MAKRKNIKDITQEDRKATMKEVCEEIVDVQPISDDTLPEFLDMPKIPPDEIQLELPYGTNDQNVIWYIKHTGKSIKLSDLKASQPWLKTFEAFKEAIDKI